MELTGESVEILLVGSAANTLHVSEFHALAACNLQHD
jgi:hypothetical protein